MSTLQLFIDLEFSWLVLCGLVWLWGYKRGWEGELIIPVTGVVVGSVINSVALLGVLVARS